MCPDHGSSDDGEDPHPSRPSAIVGASRPGCRQSQPRARNAGRRDLVGPRQNPAPTLIKGPIRARHLKQSNPTVINITAAKSVPQPGNNCRASDLRQPTSLLTGWMKDIILPIYMFSEGPPTSRCGHRSHPASIGLRDRMVVTSNRCPCSVPQPCEYRYRPLDYPERQEVGL